MRTPLLAVSVLALLILSGGCDSTPTPPPPAPMKADVQPIRNCAIKLLINSNLTYTAKDAVAVRVNLPDVVVARLNHDGIADGNTFSVANGEAQNFTLTYTINNDGSDRFSGSCYLGGWGFGYINTMYSGQYTYSNAPDMINALTDQVYNYIHTGWHDARKK